MFDAAFSYSLSPKRCSHCALFHNNDNWKIRHETNEHRIVYGTCNHIYICISSMLLQSCMIIMHYLYMYLLFGVCKSCASNSNAFFMLKLMALCVYLLREAGSSGTDTRITYIFIGTIDMTVWLLRHQLPLPLPLLLFDVVPLGIAMHRSFLFCCCCCCCCFFFSYVLRMHFIYLLCIFI